MVSESNSTLLSTFASSHNSRYQAAHLPDNLDDDSPPAEARGLSSIYDRYISDSWWFEFLSWLLATVMLLALLIVFGKFDGKSLSQWHSKLTLNTIIAVVS